MLLDLEDKSLWWCLKQREIINSCVVSRCCGGGVRRVQMAQSNPNKRYKLELYKPVVFLCQNNELCESLLRRVFSKYLIVLQKERKE